MAAQCCHHHHYARRVRNFGHCAVCGAADARCVPEFRKSIINGPVLPLVQCRQRTDSISVFFLSKDGFPLGDRACVLEGPASGSSRGAHARSRGPARAGTPAGSCSEDTQGTEKETRESSGHGWAVCRRARARHAALRGLGQRWAVLLAGRGEDEDAVGTMSSEARPVGQAPCKRRPITRCCWSLHCKLQCVLSSHL